MEFDRVKVFTSMQQIRDLHQKENKTNDEIEDLNEITGMLADIDCSFIVQKSSDDLKTFLDSAGDVEFETDYILISQNGLTHIILEPIKYDVVNDALFNNEDIMYGDWKKYHEAAARLEGE